MINMLAAIRPAPRYTNPALCRQIRSTIWPSGIFSAQGSVAQKPRAARNWADKLKYSLTKNVPTMAVRPEIPAAAYTMSGGR